MIHIKLNDLVVNVVAGTIVTLARLLLGRLLPEFDTDLLTLIASMTSILTLLVIHRLRTRGSFTTEPIIIPLGTFLLTMVVLLLSFPPYKATSGCDVDIPPQLTMVYQVRTGVPADKYWYDTGITIEKGDWLKLTSEGEWWNGVRKTGPEGDMRLIGRPSCGPCPVVDGNMGELVGKVADGMPFRIGRCSIESATQAGNLFLAMNENTGACVGGRTGSCYEDNNGSLQVLVSVFQ